MLDDLSSHPPGAPALIEGGSGRTASFGELVGLVERRAERLKGLSGGLALLGMSPTIDAVVDLYALLSVGATTALVDPATPERTLAAWVDAFRPHAWWGLAALDGRVPRRSPGRPSATAVLLATSGSTGSAKFVRLSAANLSANARQIRAALSIDASQVALAHLALHYSYGLSVLNSHLLAGSCVVLADVSPLQPAFWDLLRDHRVTTLPGVPFTYGLLARLGLADLAPASLRVLTQAGGPLPAETYAALRPWVESPGRSLYVMYGQTEATARISVLPPDELPARFGSVGLPVEGTRVSVGGAGAGHPDELVVTGPSVMLGYASSADELDAGDELHGTLHTGDLGRVDEDGFVWITGRAKRISKAFGLRVSLDDVERRLGAGAAVDGGDRIVVFAEGPSGAPGAHEVERDCGLPRGSVRVVAVDALPRTASGKVDYAALAVRAREG